MNTVLNTNPDSFVNEPPSSPDANFMNKLPNLLRFLGASALIIAMYSFLANGWNSGNDLFRYLLMLGHTGILAAVGLMSGHWLKEGKGARLLLTLALVSIPANFAILGAFIFSQSVAVDISQYPQYVAWTVNSLNTALVTSAGAMLLLAPITLLGFTVLARGMSKKLSLLFLLSNAALLLPFRDPYAISVLVVGLILAIVIFSSKAANNNTAAKTREGITALGLQLLPLAVLLGRGLWLYSAELFMMTAVSITIYFALRQLSLYMTPNSRFRNTLNVLSFIPAVLTAPLLSMSLLETHLIALELVIPVSAMIAAAMVFDIATRSQKGGAVYHRIASTGLVISFISNLLMFGGLLATLACITVGLGLLLWSYKHQQLSEFTAGIILMLFGILHQLYQLVHHFDLGSWISLAMLGLVSIVVASTIESQGGKLKPRIDALKNNFNRH